MCGSIQRFMGHVFCSSIVGFDFTLQNELHYFDTRHGKGEWDGVVVVVKRRP